MHSTELSPNVDPITRDYINLVIQEALTPSLNEVWQAIERINSMAPSATDTTGLELRVETSVTDKLSVALSDLVQRNVTSIREELSSAIEDLRAELSDNKKADADLRQLFDTLDLKIKRWAESDRYSLTRAQVLKAMREAND